MTVQKHLDRFLLELLSVRPPRSRPLLAFRLNHKNVLPLPGKIRGWTVHKKPSTPKCLEAQEKEKPDETKDDAPTQQTATAPQILPSAPAADAVRVGEAS